MSTDGFAPRFTKLAFSFLLILFLSSDPRIPRLNLKACILSISVFTYR